MKRKVIKHGPSTFIVSLPVNWVKRYGITKGKELEITENGRTLNINTDSVKINEELSKDISGLSPGLVHAFLSILYLEGHDKIMFKYDNIEILEKIQKQIPQLIGYEIVEQDNKKCLIQSISQKIDLDFDNSLRRALIILGQTLEMANEAYIKDDKETLKNIQLRDLEVNRLCYFCLRQITKENYNKGFEQETYSLYYLITTLERFGDGLKDMSVHLSKTKRKNKDIMILLGLLIDYYKIVYSYFCEPTKDKANKEFNAYREIKLKFENTLGKNMTKDEIMVAYLIKDSTYKISNFVRMRLSLFRER